jgi:hypothetical protein
LRIPDKSRLMQRGHSVEEAAAAVKLTESLMSDLDRIRKWKTHYWATQRAYAQGQLDYLRKGQFQLTGKDGRDHLADQIGQHERDLAFANDRLEEVRSN